MTRHERKLQDQPDSAPGSLATIRADTCLAKLRWRWIDELTKAGCPIQATTGTS